MDSENEDEIPTKPVTELQKQGKLFTTLIFQNK